MPGTDVVQDSEYARTITKRIADSARTVVFSYAKESAEGKQKRSPLLAGLGFEEVSAAELVDAPSERAVLELEEVEDVARIQALPGWRYPRRREGP